MTDINQEIKELEAAFVSLEANLVSLKAKAKAQQEPTLTPVSFESKGELAKALIDGRTFKTPAGTTLMYDISSGYDSPFRRTGQDGTRPMLEIWRYYYNLQEINAAWYLNIPKGGIKCYVSDEHPNPSAESGWVRVVEYDASWTIASFRSRGIGWKYATPVNEVKHK